MWLVFVFVERNTIKQGKEKSQVYHLKKQNKVRTNMGNKL